MNKIINFVENYYNNDLKFDNEEFLSIIDILLKEVQNFKDVNELNLVLSHIMNSFQSEDYYLVMQIFEYDLIKYFQ